MKTTVRDVAARAKVSIGTVSRVLNGNGSVDADTAERVRSAARSLNYRRLRRRAEAPGPGRPLEGRTVGLVLLGMNEMLSSLPVVMTAIQGVEAEAAAGGARLLLVNCPDLTWPAHLKRERFDGLVLKAALQGRLAEAADEGLRRRLAGVPAVWVMGRPEGVPGDAVGPHDARAGALAADALLSAGHRRVAFLNPKPDHLLWRARGAGFRDRVCAAGGEVREFLGEPAHAFPQRPVHQLDAVQGLFDRLLAADPRPTAVFAPVDGVAALVYRAAAARGVRVGLDLGLVGCNYEPPLTAGLYPPLTTLDIHPAATGREAVRQLARRLADPGGPAVEILIDPRPVAGESVGGPTAAPA